MQTVAGGVPDFTPFIRYHTFAESSIDFSVILRAREFVDQYLIKHEFVKRLHARFEREGIVIPFPIRTIVRHRAEAGLPSEFATALVLLKTSITHDNITTLSFLSDVAPGLILFNIGAIFEASTFRLVGHRDRPRGRGDLRDRRSAPDAPRPAADGRSQNDTRAAARGSANRREPLIRRIVGELWSLKRQRPRE
jgi:hypothetical protein